MTEEMLRQLIDVAMLYMAFTTICVAIIVGMKSTSPKPIKKPMRHIHSKSNLLRTLDNLRAWVENNMVEDGRRDNPIRAISENLEEALNKTEQEYDDVFGTEGYERNIQGR